jgi:ABC-type lipoprotein release transport system permease subunit
MEMGPRGRGCPMGKIVGYNLPLSKLPIMVSMDHLALLFVLVCCFTCLSATISKTSMSK